MPQGQFSNSSSRRRVKKSTRVAGTGVREVRVLSLERVRPVLRPRVVRLGGEHLNMSTPENSDRTVRRIGRPTRPGQSGNPGGRPKGLAKAVRDASGGDPRMFVEGLLEIARG
jgi:hypothetical protein